THKGYRIPITKGLRAEMDWFDENYPTNRNGYILPIVVEEREGAALTEYIVNSRKKYSRELKIIAEILEFPEAFRRLSTYYSRHSFAMALRAKGANVDVIQQAMGHTSSATTETYLASFDDDFMSKMGDDLI
ncbi:MAG: tyrosine-type recombinase/integrase, partial [Odoribacter sp.]